MNIGMFQEFSKIAIIIFTFHVILVQSSFGQTQQEIEANKLVFSHYDTLKNSLTPQRLCYDALQYQLNLTVDPSNKFIKGTSTMKFKWIGNSKTLQLDLINKYKITSLMLDNQKVNFKRDSNFLFIDIPSSFQSGSIHFITTQYEGHPLAAKKAPWDGGFVWAKDSLGNDWVGVACEGLGASSWWPCKDHWSDEPQEGVKLSFSVPVGYSAVSNGKLVSNKTENNQSIWNWEVNNPINLYSVTLNIAKYAHFDSTYVSKVDGGKLKMDFYVLPYNLQRAKAQFMQAYNMLDCFEAKFGKYPFYEDGYKLVETPYLGMEHQSCISYGNKYKPAYMGNKTYTGGYDFDYIIVHESGHEWFGNNITAADNADMWIHEAFTTYSESIYVECNYGKDAGIEYIYKMRPRVDNDEPIQGLYGTGHEGSGDMYAKGALFLNTLRFQVNNDSLWYAYLKAINKHFYHKVTSYDEVLSFTNKFFNFNYSQLFSQYLKTIQVPELAITKKIELGNKASYTLQYNNLTPNLTMKTYVNIGNKSQQFNISSKPLVITVLKSDSLLVDESKAYITVKKVGF